MASRKKKFAPKTKTRSRGDVFREFLRDLLAGTIVATKIFVTGSVNRPTIDYDDPNG